MRAEKIGRDRQLHRDGGRAADAGFSLVELLIAVTILAIIVIPLLHLFVTSTRINVKSRQTLRATTVAQDIMEGLKAYTLEEVRTQFNKTDAAGRIVLPSDTAFYYPEDGFYILNSDLIQSGVREITELETWLDTSTGKPVDPHGVDNETYYFGIENLKMQGGEYDALIKLDASKYAEGKAGEAGDGTGHDNVFNGKFYADTMSVSETGNGGAQTDSSFHEPAGLAADVLRDIRQQIETDCAAAGEALPTDWEDAWKDMELKDIVTKREIVVKLGAARTESGALAKDKDGNGICQARTTFTYQCKCPAALAGTVMKDTNGDGTPDQAIRDFTYTSHGLAGGSGEVTDGNTLRQFSSGNFYLFYYPIYASGAVDDISFEISDISELLAEDAPLLRSVTLAKQIRSTVDPVTHVIAPDMTDAELYHAESGYKAIVHIQPNDSSVRDGLVFRTNIDTNMAKQAKRTDPDGDVYWEEILGITIPPSVNKVDLISDEVSDTVTNVIYDIEITVYEAGAAQYFGDPDFETNHADEIHRLATITNLD